MRVLDYTQWDSLIPLLTLTTDTNHWSMMSSICSISSKMCYCENRVLQVSEWNSPSGSQCVFHRLWNSAGVVLIIPQCGQDSCGVHVLHLLVVLEGVPVDVCQLPCRATAHRLTWSGVRVLLGFFSGGQDGEGLKPRAHTKHMFYYWAVS